MAEKANLEALHNLASTVETKTNPTPMPRAADLMGKAMMQSCEEAAIQVERLGKDCQQAADNVHKSADALAATIRERCHTMRDDIERLVTTLRDTTNDLNAKQQMLTGTPRKPFKE